MHRIKVFIIFVIVCALEQMRIESILGKRAIRAVGIAESFVLSFPRSVFCAVVYRSDGLVDGLTLDFATVGGDDATDTICRMLEDLDRQDIHVVLLDGCIVSWYNIVDLEKVYECCKVPVLALTFEEITGDVETAIRKVFPEDVALRKIQQFRKLPEPVRLVLPDGEIYVRVCGIQPHPRILRAVIRRFLREGKRPEPIRIAKFVANAVLRKVIRQLQ